MSVLAAFAEGSLSRLSQVVSTEWRRDRRGTRRYPEHHRWEAVEAYFDLLDASDRPSR